MTEHLQNEQGNPRYGEKEKALRRRMRIEFLGAWGIYVVFCLYWMLFLDVGEETTRVLRFIAAALAIFAVIVSVRWHFRVDEFERQIQLNGMAVGFCAAMATSVVLGILGMIGDFTEKIGIPGDAFAGMLIYSVGMIAFGAASMVQYRRLNAKV